MTLLGMTEKEAAEVPEALMAKEEDLEDDEMGDENAEVGREEAGEDEREDGDAGEREAASSSNSTTTSSSSASAAAAAAAAAARGRRNLLSLKTNSLKRSIALPRNPFLKKSKSPKTDAGGGEAAKEVDADEDEAKTIGKPSLSTAHVKSLISKVVSQLNSTRTRSKCEVSEERLQEWRRRMEEGKVPGVVGIRNHGNTCFINAILQCLSSTDVVAEYLVLDQYKSDLRRRRRRRGPPYVASLQKRAQGRGEVTEQLATLIKSLWSLQYDPEISIRFKSLVEKHASQYKGSSQHDAQEFLLWLLDQVHEDLNTAKKKKYKVGGGGGGGGGGAGSGGSGSSRTDEQLASEALASYMRCNNSFVMEVFQAQFRSSLTCHSCERQSNTFDPFLCVSLPIPQKQLMPVFVTVLYIDQSPRQVKLGLTVGVHETVGDLRRVLARDTGIPASQILLTEIGKLGFERTLRDQQPVTVLRDAKEPLYCIEVPRHRESTEDDGAYVVLAWVNVLKEGPIERRFGSPYTIQVSRETLYADLQKLLLKEMAPILHDDILISAQKVPLFKIRVLDGFEGSLTYLDSHVDLPMYVEPVEQAINLCGVERGGGPAHVKFILEWDMPAKTQVVNDDSDVIEEHASVKEVEKSPEEASSVTLQECFDLYTSAEKLGLQDAWFCPSCNRKQEVVKRMGLWSVPDVLVVHLKRFRHSSSSSANKLSTMVEFPLEGFNMAPNVSRSGNRSNVKACVQGGACASAADVEVGACNSNEADNPPDGVQGAAQASSTMRMFNAFSMWRHPKRLMVPGRGAGGGGGRADEDLVYDLYAVCNHHGSDLQGGHYTASCRNPTDGQWYSFDDVHTKCISEQDVITQDAYILFYQRQSLTTSSSSSSSSSSGSTNQEHWVFRMPDFAYKKKGGIVKVSTSSTSSPTKSKKKEKTPPPSSSSSSVFQRNSTKYATLPAKRTTEEAAEDCEPDRHSDIVEQVGDDDDDDEENDAEEEEEEEEEEPPRADQQKDSAAESAEAAANKVTRDDDDESAKTSEAKGEDDDDGISRPIDKNDVD